MSNKSIYGWFRVQKQSGRKLNQSIKAEQLKIRENPESNSRIRIERLQLAAVGGTSH